MTLSPRQSLVFGGTLWLAFVAILGYANEPAPRAPTPSPGLRSPGAQSPSPAQVAAPAQAAAPAQSPAPAQSAAPAQAPAPAQSAVLATARAPGLAVARVPAVRPVALGSDAFATSAHWEHVRGRRDGRYRGASIRSRYPGADAALDFDGISIRLFGVVGRGGGLGDIVLDGNPAYVVNFYAPHKATHALVYSSPTLARGTHHVVVRVVAPHEPSSRTPRYVNLDGADILR